MSCDPRPREWFKANLDMSMQGNKVGSGFEVRDKNGQVYMSIIDLLSTQNFEYGESKSEPWMAYLK